jgi:GntR family transcriptional repressor for pyruvate dehydrogenase complex
MSFTFKKLDRSQKPLQVANQLVEAIKEGDFEKGDRLPTEQELAERTGVSRASVREALSALRLGGLIRTEVGKGTFVEHVPEVDDLRDRILNILVDNPKPLELQEARSAFEVGVVEIATRKFSQEDDKRMAQVLDKMKASAERDEYERFLNLHQQFHLGIAQAARNKVIEDTMKHFQEIMNDRMWRELEKSHYLPDKRNYLLESHRIHRGVYSAMVDKDPELARKRLKNHFDKYA